jgi:hypothetical protein
MEIPTMANTERLAALQKVRIARNAVQATRNALGLAPEDQTALTRLFFDLDDLEDSLILEEISEKIDSLATDAKDLAKVASEIKDAHAALAKEAALVEDAAKAVNGLVQVVAAAASAGLL